MIHDMQHQQDGDAEFSAAFPTIAEGASDDFGRDSSSDERTLTDEQLVALHEVTKTLTRELNLHRALAVVAEKAQQLTLCTSTALALLDPGRETLDFVAVAGRGAVEMIGQKVRVADALPGHTAITGEPLLAFSPSHSPFPNGEDKNFTPQEVPERRPEGSPADDAFAGQGGVRSAAVVPIFLDGKSIGSLAAINRRDGQSFGGSDLLILHILASATASVLQMEKLRVQNSQTERERDILFEAARRTSSTLNVQQILDGVMGTINKSINSFAEIIFLLNDERTHLFIASERGLTEEELEIQLLAEDRLASAAFAGPGGTPYIISNGPEDPRYEVILPEDRVKPASLLVAPLISRDNPMGLIVIVSLHPNAFTEDDLRLLSAVAAQTSVAVENAWLYEDATRRAEEATAIYELSQSVNTNLNLQRVLNFVADSVIALLHVDKFALFLHNPRTSQLEIKVHRNLPPELAGELRCQADRGGIAWWVYQFETPTAVQNVSTDHRNRSCPVDQENVASLVSVPLQAGEEVIGVIHAMSSRPRLFTVAEMELLYTIANQVGFAIRNTQTLEHMRQKSVDLRRASRLVSKALGASVDSPGAAQTITDLASEIVGADRCLLYTTDRGALRLLAAHGVRIAPTAPGRDSNALSADGTETTACWIARKGKSIVISNHSPDGRLIVPAEFSQQLGKSGAYIGIPLKVGSIVVGVLEAFFRESRTVTNDEIRHFKAFGGQAAVALQNAILIQKATRRRTDLQLLGKLAADLAGGEVDERTIVANLERLAQAAGAESAVLYWSDHAYAWGKNGHVADDRDSNSDGFHIEIPMQSDVAGAMTQGRLSLVKPAVLGPFSEPDRSLAQTVADLLSATLKSPAS